jgi:hypothetical protein
MSGAAKPQRVALEDAAEGTLVQRHTSWVLLAGKTQTDGELPTPVYRVAGALQHLSVLLPAVRDDALRTYTVRVVLLVRSPRVERLKCLLVVPLNSSSHSQRHFFQNCLRFARRNRKKHPTRRARGGVTC